MKTRTLLFSLTVLLAFAACRVPEPEPRPDPDQDCDFYNQNPGWVAEDFKTDYTIRFTADYNGGITGFEGNLFFKTKQDSTIAFYYAFCGPLWCDDFGDTIQSPLPDSVELPDFRFRAGKTYATYSQNIFDVCDANQILGVLYFTEPLLDGVAGFYQGAPNTPLRESVYIEYKAGSLGEIVDILGTIEEK